jgi:hypothetical protein
MNQGVQVTQQELREIYELSRDVAQKQTRIDELKSGVKALLAAKMPVEEGRFDARLVFRRVHHVPWKQAVIDKLGLDFAERFRKSSPSSVLCDVMVEEHAIPPLWKGITGSSQADS